MADVLNNILVKKKIDNIKVLIGVSLGGMIAQKFIYKYSEIPTIFISTIIKSNLKVQTVFNSWKNNLHFLGEKGFNVNLASWVKGGILEENSLNQSKGFSVIKEELSLEAISSHNFKEVCEWYRFIHSYQWAIFTKDYKSFFFTYSIFFFKVVA